MKNTTSGPSFGLSRLAVVILCSLALCGLTVLQSLDAEPGPSVLSYPLEIDGKVVRAQIEAVFGEPDEPRPGDLLLIARVRGTA